MHIKKLLFKSKKGKKRTFCIFWCLCYFCWVLKHHLLCPPALYCLATQNRVLWSSNTIICSWKSSLVPPSPIFILFNISSDFLFKVSLNHHLCEILPSCLIRIVRSVLSQYKSSSHAFLTVEINYLFIIGLIILWSFLLILVFLFALGFFGLCVCVCVHA